MRFFPRSPCDRGAVGDSDFPSVVCTIMYVFGEYDVYIYIYIYYNIHSMICVCVERKRGTRQNGSIYKYKGVGSPLISDDDYGTVDDPKRPADFLLLPPPQPQPTVY